MSNPNFKVEDGKIKLRIRNEWIEPEFRGYEEIKLIGEPGANGAVVSGIHKVTGRKDAIKVWIPRAGSKNGIVRENQYYAEIRKVAQLKNEHIVTIYDAWIDGDCYFCSMEYIDGITFEKWLENHGNILNRLDMLYKIFSTIYFYQSKGVIHGDIHSRNIIIDQKEEVHIIDFGTSVFSRYVGQSTDRENYLMYELVEKTLENNFSSSELSVRKYSLYGEKEKIDDVRNVKSVLFSRTILEYIKILKIKYQVQNLDTYEALIEICQSIVRGVYMDLLNIVMDIQSWCSDRLNNSFSQIFLENFDITVFGENNTQNEQEELFYVSLFVYYEEYRKILNEIKSTKSKELKGILDGEEYKEFANIIEVKENLFEAHNAFMKKYEDEAKVYYKEDYLRVVLYNILEEYYKDKLYIFLREVYLQMEIIRLDKQLHNRILELSYIYRKSNNYEYALAKSKY